MIEKGKAPMALSQVRIGAQIWPGGAPDYQTWRSAVVEAEQLGADVIFGYDHFHRPAREPTTNSIPVLSAIQPDVNNFEGWTALASWGEITENAEIGLLVTGIGYRNPDLLADMARTVDHISGGRSILGLGSGWYEKDYTTYCFDYGTVKSRMDLFEQWVPRVVNRLGRLLPAPVRKIPILIGGAGERRTLPLVAKYADIWHCFEPIEEFRRKSELVDRLAAEAGREGASIERSLGWKGREAADEYVAAGGTLFTTEVHPGPSGYDFAELKDMIAWRDATRAA